MITFRPKAVNILGKTYSVIYVNRASDVDPQGRRVLWGHIDYWERKIRVYENSERGIGDRFEIILHEVLHHLDEHFKLGLDDGSDEHKKLDMLSVAVADVLLRNGWIVGTKNESERAKRKKSEKAVVGRIAR